MPRISLPTIADFLKLRMLGSAYIPARRAPQQINTALRRVSNGWNWVVQGTPRTPMPLCWATPRHTRLKEERVEILPETLQRTPRAAYWPEPIERAAHFAAEACEPMKLPEPAEPQWARAVLVAGGGFTLSAAQHDDAGLVQIVSRRNEGRTAFLAFAQTLIGPSNATD